MEWLCSSCTFTSSLQVMVFPPVPKQAWVWTGGWGICAVLWLGQRCRRIAKDPKEIYIYYTFTVYITFGSLDFTPICWDKWFHHSLDWLSQPYRACSLHGWVWTGGWRLCAVSCLCFGSWKKRKDLGTKPDNFLLLDCGSGSCCLNAMALL